MVGAYEDPTYLKHHKLQRTSGEFSCVHLANWTHKPFQSTDVDDDKLLRSIVASLKAGHPSIVYTNVYGRHIFVIVGYDECHKLFYANNPRRKAKGGCEPNVIRLGPEKNKTLLNWENLKRVIQGRPISEGDSGTPRV